MQALQIKLRASWILASTLLVAHGTAMAIIGLVGMPVWLVLIVLAALILSCLLTVRQAALLLMPVSVVAIEITPDNLLSVQTRHGDWIECEVLGSSYVAWFLTVLNLREVEKGTVRHIVIMPDGIEAEDFRAFRVWLRWQRGAQTG